MEPDRRKPDKVVQLDIAVASSLHDKTFFCRQHPPPTALFYASRRAKAIEWRARRDSFDFSIGSEHRGNLRSCRQQRESICNFQRWGGASHRHRIHFGRISSKRRFRTWGFIARWLAEDRKMLDARKLGPILRVCDHPRREGDGAQSQNDACDAYKLLAAIHCDTPMKSYSPLCVLAAVYHGRPGDSSPGRSIETH